MAKHRRWSDKIKSEELENKPNSENKEEISVDDSPYDLKSRLLSGTKYVYIVAITALLSGIFTPLTIGADIDLVAYGMLSIFLGLGGGILIFLGLKNQKSRSLMICAGLGMMVISLILIHELANRSILGN